MKRISALICVVSCCTGCFSHPSDTVFRRRFVEKRDAFTAIVRDVEASRISGYITPSQQASILRRLHSPLDRDDFHLAHRDDGSVLFGYSAYGLAIAGSRKGIAHVPAKSLRFYKVLSAEAAWPNEEGDFLKPLDGDWYIYVIN